MKRVLTAKPSTLCKANSSTQAEMFGLLASKKKWGLQLQLMQFYDRKTGTTQTCAFSLNPGNPMRVLPLPYDEKQTDFLEGNLLVVQTKSRHRFVEKIEDKTFTSRAEIDQFMLGEDGIPFGEYNVKTLVEYQEGILSKNILVPKPSTTQMYGMTVNEKGQL